MCKKNFIKDIQFRHMYKFVHIVDKFLFYIQNYIYYQMINIIVKLFLSCLIFTIDIFERL